MARQEINIGTHPNDGNGETLRSGAVKINENFIELYSLIGENNQFTFVNSIIAGNGISIDTDTGDVTITNSSPYVQSFQGLAVATQSTLAASSNQILTVAAGNNITLTTNTSSNTLTIAAASQVQADWNAVSGVAAILNKPTITPQVQSDWNQNDNTHVDYIKNRPTLVTDFSQLTDYTYVLGGDNYKVLAHNDQVNPNTTGVIYTSSFGDTATGIKAIIRVGGAIGGSTIQTHICEMTIARTPMDNGVSVVASTVYGEAHTAGALATFSARWNNVSERIEITATNLSSVAGEILYSKVVATELRN